MKFNLKNRPKFLKERQSYLPCQKCFEWFEGLEAELRELSKYRCASIRKECPEMIELIKEILGE